MATSYSKYIDLLKLLVYYTLDSQVSLSLSMFYLGCLEFGKHKYKLRTIYSKNHENFKNSKLGFNFTVSYKKRVKLIVIKKETLSQVFSCHSVRPGISPTLKY